MQFQPIAHQIGRRLEETSLYQPLKRAYKRSQWPLNRAQVAWARRMQTSPRLRQPVVDYFGPDTSKIDQEFDSTATPMSPRSNNVNWQGTWMVLPNVVRFAPGFWQPDLMHPGGDNTHHCYYEYRGPNWNWQIGLTRATQVTGPFINHEFPILEPSGEPGTPDETGVADPTVLYRENVDPSWHMWFDMRDADDIWRLGHATSEDGQTWSKQTDGRGQTEVVLDIGPPGDWDDEFVHAPEAFVYDGEVRLIYSAQGTGHDNYHSGLAIASDSDSNGYSFEKYGQTTDDKTITGGDNIRIKPPFFAGDTMYALHSRDVEGIASVCRSLDGGKTWQEVCSFSYPWANSFVMVDHHLVGIGGDNALYLSSQVSAEVN